MPERRILETTQLLGALPPDTLETLRRQSTIRTVARNEVLFRQGEDSSELYGIVNGRIAILTRSPDWSHSPRLHARRPAARTPGRSSRSPIRRSMGATPCFPRGLRRPRSSPGASRRP